MNLIITKANQRYLNECETALMNSNLGENYFSNKDKVRSALNEGLKKQELYVVLSDNGSFIGFFWLIINGAFHSFPYLHMIVVKEEMRGQGYGKRILKEIEDMCFKEYSKLFLVVADFNPQAKKLYEELGYKMVGFIPDLYKSGIGEQIMMKSNGEIHYGHQESRHGLLQSHRHNEEGGFGLHDGDGAAG